MKMWLIEPRKGTPSPGFYLGASPTHAYKPKIILGVLRDYGGRSGWKAAGYAIFMIMVMIDVDDDHDLRGFNEPLALQIFRDGPIFLYNWTCISGMKSRRMHCGQISDLRMRRRPYWVSNLKRQLVPTSTLDMYISKAARLAQALHLGPVEFASLKSSGKALPVASHGLASSNGIKKLNSDLSSSRTVVHNDSSSRSIH